MIENKQRKKISNRLNKNSKEEKKIKIVNLDESMFLLQTIRTVLVKPFCYFPLLTVRNN